MPITTARFSQAVAIIGLCMVLASTAQAIDSRSMEMYNEMMRYRTSRGLPAIPLCRHLSTVAAAHVADLQATNPRAPCNMHSWSQSPRWSSCCYTDNHAAARCMWNKPKELSGYRGNGYEISHGAWGARVTPKGAVDGWRGSGAHNEVMVNAGMWRQPWRAVGVAIGSNYAVAWFGKEPCPP